MPEPNRDRKTITAKKYIFLVLIKLQLTNGSTIAFSRNCAQYVVSALVKNFSNFPDISSSSSAAATTAADDHRHRHHHQQQQNFSDYVKKILVYSNPNLFLPDSDSNSNSKKFSVIQILNIRSVETDGKKIYKLCDIIINVDPGTAKNFESIKPI